MKINGMSQYRIADVLNEQGILSPMEYKKYLGSHFESSFKVNPKAVWTANAVTRILTNEVYNRSAGAGKTDDAETTRLRYARKWMRLTGFGLRMPMKA